MEKEEGYGKGIVGKHPKSRVPYYYYIIITHLKAAIVAYESGLGGHIDMWSESGLMRSGVQLDR